MGDLTKTDPLVARIVVAAERHGEAQEYDDLERTEKAVLAEAARLSAVLAEARAVAAAYAGPGFEGRDYDPDEVAGRACDLCNALAAADAEVAS